VKRFVPVILIVIAILGWNQFYGGGDTSERVRSADSGPVATYSEWRSGEQVQGQGVVIRLLSDDNEGSRHQRFIVRLKTGQTLLIAHNIDIAPRVSSLQKGDTISFNGEYEWNDKGGVIHWTHRDPQRHHQSGWIEHDGRLYQ
jgi:hypothetical protein